MQGEGAAQPERQVRYRWAAQLCGSSRVLDAACGAGWGTALLAASGASAVGVDVSPAAIAAARRDHGERAEFQEADVRELPFAEAEFDCVLCFEAITHLADPGPALDELCRVLRPGGTLLVSAPNPKAYPPGNPLQLSELPPRQLEQSLRERLANVAIYSQHAYFASLLCDSGTLAAAAPDATIDVETDKLTSTPPGSELYAIAVASDGELPPPPARLALGEDVDYAELTAALREWQERAVAAETEALSLRRQLRATREAGGEQ